MKRERNVELDRTLAAVRRWKNNWAIETVNTLERFFPGTNFGNLKIDTAFFLTLKVGEMQVSEPQVILRTYCVDHSSAVFLDFKPSEMTLFEARALSFLVERQIPYVATRVIFKLLQATNSEQPVEVNELHLRVLAKWAQEKGYVNLTVQNGLPEKHEDLTVVALTKRSPQQKDKRVIRALPVRASLADIVKFVLSTGDLPTPAIAKKTNNVRNGIDLTL